jgi:hypothetical protein
MNGRFTHFHSSLFPKTTNFKKEGNVDSMVENLKIYVSLNEKKYGDRDTHFIRAVINSTIELDTVSFTNTFIKELQICYLNYKNGFTPKEDIQLYWKLIDYYNDALYTAGKYQESLTLLTEIVHFNTIHNLRNQFNPRLLSFLQRLFTQYKQLLRRLFTLWHQNDSLNMKIMASTQMSIVIC